MLHEMNIVSVAVDPKTNTPVVVLKSLKDDQTLMIWIGALEAGAIIYALQGMSFERPLTHDLFKNFLEKIAFRITKIEICDLENNTFFAKLYFGSGDSEFVMDARPSDAMAMAVRFNAPIYAEESVIVRSKQNSEKPEIMDESEEGKKWAEYLEALDNDDFGKYKI